MRIPVPNYSLPTLGGGGKKLYLSFLYLCKEERRRKGFVKLMVCDA